MAPCCLLRVHVHHCICILVEVGRVGLFLFFSVDQGVIVFFLILVVILVLVLTLDERLLNSLYRHSRAHESIIRIIIAIIALMIQLLLL